MPYKSDAPLRVALLCHESIPGWSKAALETMVSGTDAEITLVVLSDSDGNDDGLRSFLRSTAARIWNYPLWSMLGVGRVLSSPSDVERLEPVTDVSGVPEAEWVSCTPEPADGIGNVLPDDVVDVIVAEADVVVRLAFGIVKGRVLSEPTYGVLSYHFGDIHDYRGLMGLGFWEFLNDEDEVGVTLQQINETIDGGRIVELRRIDVSDTNTWPEVKVRMLEAAQPMLSSGVENLADPTVDVREPEQLGELYSLPRGRAVVRYLIKNTAGRIRNRIPVGA